MPIPKLTIVFSFTFLLSILSLFGQTKYIMMYKPIADSISQKYGIPSTLTLAVAILESGSGTSRNAKLLNNHFGIEGKNNLLKSKGIKSRYKQFANVESSYDGFAVLLSRKKYYEKLRGNMDYALWVDALSKGGYSEVPKIWKRNILSTIKNYKLSSIQ